MFSVVEGSLDDDVDSYANDDGTMEHTLVDAPKNFNPRDLKDVASSDITRKSQGHVGQISVSHTDRQVATWGEGRWGWVGSWLTTITFSQTGHGKFKKKYVK